MKEKPRHGNHYSDEIKQEERKTSRRWGHFDKRRERFFREMLKAQT